MTLRSNHFLYLMEFRLLQIIKIHLCFNITNYFPIFFPLYHVNGCLIIRNSSFFDMIYTIVITIPNIIFIVLIIALIIIIINIPRISIPLTITTTNQSLRRFFIIFERGSHAGRFHVTPNSVNNLIFFSSRVVHDAFLPSILFTPYRCKEGC